MTGEILLSREMEKIVTEATQQKFTEREIAQMLQNRVR